MKVIKYTADKAKEWDTFVAKSTNATFLLFREYMDYHADRFSDYSLMFYDDNDHLCALLPANIISDTLFSHQGLTYGGLIVTKKTLAGMVIECFTALKKYLCDNHFTKFLYKAIPYIYHQLPSDADLYALFSIMHGHVVKRDISSAILLNNRLGFTESRRSGIRKALRENLVFEESDSFEAFWHMLETNLSSRYDTKPVHTLQEIELLHSRFPENIRLFTVKRGRDILAGTVLYLTHTVVHTQYIASSAEGRSIGANDFLFDNIINGNLFSSQQYFDFGISTDPKTNKINAKLLFQKEHFGGRAICYDTYEVHLDTQ